MLKLHIFENIKNWDIQLPVEVRANMTDVQLQQYIANAVKDLLEGNKFLHYSKDEFGISVVKFFIPFI